jgi:hypothetical protein
MSEGLATDTTDTYDGLDDGYDLDTYDLDDELEDDDELGEDDDELDDEGELDEDELDDEGELDEDEADEVVLGLLERIENAEELDRHEIRDLGLLLGDRRAAAALGRALNAEAKQARAARPKRRGFWHWFFGPGHEQGDPIPDGLAALLLRIGEGRPLDWNDFKRLGQVVGRRSVRLLEGLIHGAVARDQARTRQRGGRR